MLAALQEGEDEDHFAFLAGFAKGAGAATMGQDDLWLEPEDEALTGQAVRESLARFRATEKEARQAYISACEKSGMTPTLDLWESVMNNMAESAGLEIPYRND
jgi:hypothetical protein